jgi:phenylalanyl-tRNA synthetase alpha chain
MKFMPEEMKEKMPEKGHLHPVTLMIESIHTIFRDMGFDIARGPEIETEFNNFDALNVPKDHPARDMQDTFWIKTDEDRLVLRTHTTAVDIRYMQEHKPPFRIIAPGKVFRNEATDATHEAQFYQIDGIAIDKTMSLANLKGTLLAFFKKLLGEDIEIRFRPSYFPFVEPGVEVDIKFNGKWLEVMGAGMLHPNVFKACGLDPKEWKGFAFGGGIDRLAMIKYNIPDVRLFYGGDLRLINQF